jgi:hypothetical protein
LVVAEFDVHPGICLEGLMEIKIPQDRFTNRYFNLATSRFLNQLVLLEGLISSPLCNSINCIAIHGVGREA